MVDFTVLDMWLLVVHNVVEAKGWDMLVLGGSAY